MLTEKQQENDKVFKQIMDLIAKLDIQRKDNTEKTDDAVFFIAVQNHKDGKGDKINVLTSFAGSDAGLADGFNEILQQGDDNPLPGPILNAASNILGMSDNPMIQALADMVASYAQSEYNAMECDCAECRAERERNKCKDE
jgi:hypothetical protein